ncbi:protein CONSERVED ONLY IN THE GREEN LINEAGE 160, chloroplastic [Andrographis paniculata]|uniref:protein CONSERVED ONLY IN THE GREEN LINEAGE 160, chloroplastic n=1 Tax=Andrographis paniculata TaxID=175694 RepID=UPI0021E734E8|nr:protein CONSERVED ONLY IN THE GREEN LINEAGE 160, chloroplastic [Andrographis paniculata]
MAVVNCCLSVTSTTSPDSPNPSSPSSSSQRLPTKIILPSKKPLKWSTGVAPGEYGGPPTTTKLRKYWGGDEDPLASDDYLWNKDFMDRMKKFIKDPDDDAASADVSAASSREPSGFLSLNRVMSLDNLEVDLSKELSGTSATSEPSAQEHQVEEPTMRTGKRWRPAPTRREQEKWDRATKAATGGSDVMFRESRRSIGDPEVLAAQSREQYYKLKNKLQLLTLGIGGVGVVSSYFSYTPEIAASYGFGLLGSLAYMRMLGNTVDSMADGARGLVKGAVGQPRLLVPVVLVMLYNRWNGILVPDYGLMHLELIPMLVGFFTYKIATFTQALEDAVKALGGENQA